VTAALQARDRMYLPRRTGDLLEVGFGAGAFLQRRKAEGWAVTGLDFDPTAVERVRSQLGLNVHCGSLQDAAFAERSFDVIAMSHVIEHLPDPRAVLRECFRILRPGGTLVLITPNTASLGHRWFGRDWFGTDAPRHLYLFNLENLSALVSQHGFTVQRAFSTFANAHIFFGGSLGQRSFARRGLRHAKPSGMHTVAGNILQWIERVYLAFQDERRSSGEEAVVIALRPPDGSSQ
jgi:2-polyprenyl-3-methyl-5-hydroxy-6-metoxy-1,4-benzoquinol methylase